MSDKEMQRPTSRALASLAAGVALVVVIALGVAFGIVLALLLLDVTVIR